MTELAASVKWLLGDIERFSARAGGIRLRAYQKAVAHAILGSVLGRQGRSFVVIFPRQSGKNELQAQIECYLLLLLSQTPAEIVKVSPTLRPQAQNAMFRLRRALQRNPLTRLLWAKEHDRTFRIGQARISFFSGAPQANIVGATASTLLEVDEAQDVSIEKYDKEIAPMAASTNATRVFWGTAWTAHTLLAREKRAARQAEQADGCQRVFRLDADAVAAEVPAYGQFVAEQVARLGRSHPMVKTQFFSEELAGEGGMFPPWRQALMHGTHAAQAAPRPGALYALLVDVAGEDAGLSAGLSTPANPLRDATALTIVEVDGSTLKDALIQRPTYRVVQRQQWVGVGHALLYARLHAIANQWRARWMVVDATGVGAGLASFLVSAFPGRVLPFTFNMASKSKLGWGFLNLVDAGRWQEPAEVDILPEQARLQRLFFRQAEACTQQLLPGANRLMRWSVPESARDPQTNAPLHDDLLLSAALAAALDERDWQPGSAATVIRTPDPLKELDHGF